MDVVIRTPHGEAEITIARAGEATAIADIVERVTGSASPPIADVDGRAVLTTATIGSSGVVTGSVIDLGATTRAAPQDAVLELVQVAGWGAGARQPLGPGTYRVGPGRRVNAADLDLAHVDKIAFELSVDADGAAMVTVDEKGVRIDGIGIEGSTAWSTGILDVAGRAFVLDRGVGPHDPPTPVAGAEPSGIVVFNRPPRPARASAPPPLAVPDDLSGAELGAPRSSRPRWFDIRRPARATPSSAPRSRRVGAAERHRRHDLFPHIAGAVQLAGSTSPRLWSTRPDDDHAFELAIGLGDIDWRPELSFGSAPIEIAESIVAELGPLPMVPVTVDFDDRARDGVRGLERVHAGSRSRLARRGVRPTRPRRSRGGRPHRSRSSAGLGVGQVVAAQPHVRRRPGTRRPRPGRRLGGVHQGRPPGRASTRSPDAGRGRLSGVVA